MPTTPPISPAPRFATSFDGAPIAYRVWGAGEPTVMLQNGIACHQVFLDALIAELSRRCRVVHWHYRGHGDSPPPARPTEWTLAMNVKDMEAVRAAVGPSKVVVGGFSMGVQLNLEYYRHHPRRVAGLIQIAGAYEHPLRSLALVGRFSEKVFPELHRLVQTLPGAARLIWRTLLGGPWAYRAAGIVIYDGDRMPRAAFDLYQRHFMNIDLDQFTFGLLELNRHTAADLLPRVRVPMLIIAGTKDRFTPIALNEEMHRLAPGSELLVVEGGTHATLLEHPDLVNEHVARFLESRFGATLAG